MQKLNNYVCNLLSNFYRCKNYIIFVFRRGIFISWECPKFKKLNHSPSSSWVIHSPSKSNKGWRTYCSSHIVERLMTSCQHTRQQLWNVEEIKPHHEHCGQERYSPTEKNGLTFKVTAGIKTYQHDVYKMDTFSGLRSTHILKLGPGLEE